MNGIPGEELIKAGIEKVGEPLYKDAFQSAAQQVGKTLDTVFGIPNLFLDPVKFVQDWWSAKFKHLRDKVEQRANGIPPERLLKVQLEDVLPILEAYKNVKVEDEDLQEMFANLLASYMDSETKSSSHRAFVKILEEMSPLEAKILKQIKEEKLSIVVWVGTIAPHHSYKIPLLDLSKMDGFADFLGGCIDLSGRVDPDFNAETEKKLEAFKYHERSFENLERLKLIYIKSDFDPKKLETIARQEDRITIEEEMNSAGFIITKDYYIMREILVKRLNAANAGSKNIFLKPYLLTCFGEDFCQTCIK